MEKIKILNSAANGAQFGETSRCDLLEDELDFRDHVFKKRYEEPTSDESQKQHTVRGIQRRNTLPQPKLAESHTESNVRFLNSIFSPLFLFLFGLRYEQMPKEFTWLNISDVNHTAYNQGRCGSCWAFSAITALEMQSVLEGNPFLEISKQQGVDWFVDN